MISSTLDRRGKLTDIYIVLDRNTYLKGFIELLTKEDISHSFEDLGQPGRVDFYIAHNVPTKQTKKKQKNDQQEEYVGSKSCALSQTEALLMKYLPDMKPREIINPTSKLFLKAWVIDYLEYPKLDDSIFEEFRDESVKNLLILESVRDWAKANEKLMEFNNTLILLQMEHNIDHTMSQTREQTHEILIGCISSTIQAKHSKIHENFQGSKHINDENSKLAGITNTFQLEWMSMLMAIQGISETKARSIVKQYPSYKCLMNAYRSLPVEQRMNMLSTITYHKYIDDNTNPKKLGQKLSERIYLLFTTTNPNDYLYS